LRGERDKRYYYGLFDNSSYIRGIKRQLILWRATRLEPESYTRIISSNSQHLLNKPTIVEFKGMEGWHHITEIKQRNYIQNRLLSIVSHSVKKALADDNDINFLGVHVRRGDKTVLPYGANRPIEAPWGCCFSNKWFATCIKSIRLSLGYTIPVKIFSDARPEELGEIFQLGGVTLAKPNSSITDILIMSRARILIPTSTSSFSLWASYLGGMPTIWYPGYQQTMREENSEFDSETDLLGNISTEYGAILRSISTNKNLRFKT